MPPCSETALLYPTISKASHLFGRAVGMLVEKHLDLAVMTADLDDFVAKWEVNGSAVAVKEVLFEISSFGANADVAVMEDSRVRRPVAKGYTALVAKSVIRFDSTKIRSRGRTASDLCGVKRVSGVLAAKNVAEAVNEI